MTEYGYPEMEALYREGAAAHFERTLLHGAFMQCAKDERYTNRAVVRRTGIVKTIEGEKQLEFNSSYDVVVGQREYQVQLMKQEDITLGQLSPEVRAQLLATARAQLILI